MGEYAKYQGQEVKIGTCESMYYLRADQAQSVQALSGNVDPVRDRAGIRFRFPFPAEDGTEPGAFNYPLPDVIVSYPAELPAEHGTVQVETPQHATRRLATALPCPTTDKSVWHPFVRDYAPAVRIAYQGYREGVLAVIVSCAYCDGMWNLPSWEYAEALVVSIRAEADQLRKLGEHRRDLTHMHHGPDVGDGLAEREIAQAAELHIIADRITAGYVTCDNCHAAPGEACRFDCSTQWATS